MSDTEKKRKIIHRYPPCPSYDVEGIQSWLTDMAKDGYLLEKDGMWCGFMSFEKTAPQFVRYSLQASKKSDPFTDNDRFPTTEEQEISEAFGWEYLTTYGQFYIYRTIDPNARPMNTDQEVLAMSLNSVRKRERNSLIVSVISLLLWIFLLTRGSLWVQIAEMGTPLSLLFLIVLIWSEVSQIITFLQLHQLYRKIRDGGTIDNRKDWKKNAGAHRIETIVYLLLILLIITICLRGCYRSVMEEDMIPLSGFTENPPFITIADLDPNAEYQENAYLNEVRVKHDVLFTTTYSWYESATLTGDGQTLSGSLLITYHETAFPWLAKCLAKSYLREEQDSKYFHHKSLPDLNVDYAVATGSSPTVIIQDDNIIIKAVIFLYDENQNSQYQQWTMQMAQLLQEQKPPA